MTTTPGPDRGTLRPGDAAGTSRILTLVFTDLAGSTALKTQGSRCAR